MKYCKFFCCLNHKYQLTAVWKMSNNVLSSKRQYCCRSSFTHKSRKIPNEPNQTDPNTQRSENANSNFIKCFLRRSSYGHLGTYRNLHYIY